MYFFPKIHKKLDNILVPLFLTVLHWWKKIEFLDHCIEYLIWSAKSHVKDTRGFLNKLKSLGKVPDNATLLTGNVVGLYPSIPHKDGLTALSAKLEEQQDSGVFKNDLLKIAEFVLKNNIFWT